MEQGSILFPSQPALSSPHINHNPDPGNGVCLFQGRHFSLPITLPGIAAGPQQS